MSESKVEVKTYLKRYYCDDDNCNGEMKPTGHALASFPPQYPHICDQCGVRNNFMVQYPYYDHE